VVMLDNFSVLLLLPFLFFYRLQINCKLF